MICILLSILLLGPQQAPTQRPSAESAQALRESRQTLPPTRGQTRWTEQTPKISLSLKNAELTEVLRSFARLAQVNLVLDPNLSAKPVTVELHDVPWPQALIVILKSQGLAAELDGRVLHVGSRAALPSSP